MRDYYIFDEELFDKVEVNDSEGKSPKEIKKELKHKKIIKAIKIMLYALIGSGMAGILYKTSNEKEKNTDYLNRF